MVRTKSLDSFVAIDIETTGTDPERDEIIELAGVRVRSGEVAERIEQLVSPTKPIPPAITRLTGISDADCADKPPISSILPTFHHFLGDDPVVLHNAPFDLAFLNRQLKSNGMGEVSGMIFDTLSLSRIALPRLRNHRLSTLLSHFRIPSPQSHRASADAEGTARLFLALEEYVSGFDLEALQTMVQLTPVGSSLRHVFGHAVRTAPVRRMGRRRECSVSLLDFVNVEGDAERTRTRRPAVLEVKAIESAFRPDGPLSTALPHYEERPQQVRMARRVAQAFNNAEFLVVEAGTGVGKSLAYLVPAVHWALESGERVIVSTKTKNLQEQLFYNDIPLLRDATARPFKAVLLKGRSSYICLNKWYRTLTEADFRQEQQLSILPLVQWLRETTSGDISENTGFKLARNSWLWNRICAEGDTCLGQNCTYKERCFSQKVRSAARGAHIVITNHALLFSDALADHSVLDRYRCLVFDEAHTIEKTAAQHFGHDLVLWRVLGLVNRLYVKEKIETGLLALLLRRVQRAPIRAAHETLTRHLRKAMDLTDRVRAAGIEFFGRLSEEILRTTGRTPGRYRVKLRYDMKGHLPAIESESELPVVLTGLAGELSRICTGLSELPTGSLPAQAELTQDVSAGVKECEELISDFLFLQRADDEGFVYWAEHASHQGQSDARLHAAPLDISEQMASHFYKHLKTIILTSATLTVAGRFDYTLRRLGLDPELTAQLTTGSPFDFRAQALVCVPSFLPSPKETSFKREVGQLIEEIVLATRRGTLVLFTSYDMLTSTYEDLKDVLEREGILLLCQGMDGSRSSIMDQFKEEEGSVLMGTDSFWEGVDAPGHALEVLFVTKLPFAVPTEPIIEAQMEAFERRGLDPFRHYCLPEAVIKFRQGFGRLIRRRDDRGVVLICDRRVLTSRYGSLFLNSLPTRPRRCPTKEKLLTEITTWLEQKREHQC